MGKDKSAKKDSKKKPDIVKQKSAVPALSKDILAQAETVTKASKKAQINGKEDPPKTTPVAARKKVTESSDDSSDSSSSEESSGNGSNAGLNIRFGKPPLSTRMSIEITQKPYPSDDSEESSDEADSSDDNSDSEESSDEESDTNKKVSAPVKTAPATAPMEVDDSDDSDDTSTSEESSSKAPLPPKKTSSSEDKSEDGSSSEVDDDEEDETSTPVQPEANKKRKADSEAVAPPKKVKLANGHADTSGEETTSIFVGRLSWNVDNDWLAQEFAECGEVESAQVQMDRNTGRSRGFGYVHFKTADAVEKALALNGKEIDGRAVNIDKSSSPDKKASAEKRARTFGDTPSSPTAVLFVGNLSFGVDEDMLWETFGEHGDVKSVRVPTDRDTGKPKGFAYVEFSEAEAAKTAHGALQGFELDGRSIRLDYSQPRDGAGGRGGGPGDRGGRGRGGFGGDRGRGGFGGDRGRGVGRGGWRGGDRGGRGRGRGGDRGWRGGDRGGRGRGRGSLTGAAAQFEGHKTTFD